MVDTRGRGSRRDQQQGEEAPRDPLQVILNELNEQRIAINQIRERQEEQAKQNEEREDRRREQQDAGPQIPPEPNQKLLHEAMTRFNKHHPPSFAGLADVVVAENWMKPLEMIFKVMPCTSE